MTDTPIDLAHAAMEAASNDEAARMRFYERVADSELFLLLEREAVGEDVSPQIFPVEGENLVLAFDREDRLAEFTGTASPYIALSGRVLAGMLAEHYLGLGLNLEVAPSSIMIPHQAVVWLNETLGTVPEDVEAVPEEILPPSGLPESLVTGLDTKLALAAGLAKAAYLCGVAYEGGTRTHMLAFIGAVDGAETALAEAVNEALIFSGVEAGSLDVAFFAASDTMAAKLAKVGLRFDLPVPEKAAERPIPGSDPERPPILK